MGPDLLLLLLLVGLPLRFLALDLILVVVDEFFLPQLEVAVNIVEALLVLLFDLDTLLLDNLLGISSNERVFKLGREASWEPSDTRAHVATVFNTEAHLLSLSLHELLPVDLVKGVILHRLAGLSVAIVDLFILI